MIRSFTPRFDHDRLAGEYLQECLLSREDLPCYFLFISEFRMGNFNQIALAVSLLFD